MLGGTGNDKVYGGLGNDYLNGNEGDDYLEGGGGDDEVRGGQDQDTVLGGDGNDKVYGDLGNDYVGGNAGNDYVDGGDGDDEVHGGRDNDTVIGGNGNDHIYGDLGNDVVTGGAGFDTFHFKPDSGTTDRVTDFNIYEDKIDLSEFATITNFHQLKITQKGSDTYIDLGSAQNIILENFVADTLTPDYFIGGASVENTSDGTYIGTSDNDYLMGGSGNDVIEGLDGNDVLRGRKGNDFIKGGYGDDVIYGGQGDDTLAGNQGDDIIYGRLGNDIIYGGKNDDTLYGDDGDDELHGQLGNNILNGGPGADRFVMKVQPGATETINDFEINNYLERIDITKFGNIQFFEDLKFTQVGNDTHVDLGANQKIILKNVQATQLKSQNFLGAWSGMRTANVYYVGWLFDNKEFKYKNEIVYDHMKYYVINQFEAKLNPKNAHPNKPWNKIDLSRFNLSSLNFFKQGTSTIVDLGQGIVLEIKNVDSADLGRRNFILSKQESTAWHREMAGDWDPKDQVQIVPITGKRDRIYHSQGRPEYECHATSIQLINKSLNVPSIKYDIFKVENNVKEMVIDTFNPDNAYQFVDISAFNFKYFSDLGVETYGNDTHVHLGSGKTLILRNVNAKKLSARNFLGISSKILGNYKIYILEKDEKNYVIDDFSVHEFNKRIDLTNFPEITKFSQLIVEQVGKDAVVYLGKAGQKVTIKGVNAAHVKRHHFVTGVELTKKRNLSNRDLILNMRELVGDQRKVVANLANELNETHDGKIPKVLDLKILSNDQSVDTTWEILKHINEVIKKYNFTLKDLPGLMNSGGELLLDIMNELSRDGTMTKIGKAFKTGAFLALGFGIDHLAERIDVRETLSSSGLPSESIDELSSKVATYHATAKLVFAVISTGAGLLGGFVIGGPVGLGVGFVTGVVTSHFLSRDYDLSPGKNDISLSVIQDWLRKVTGDNDIKLSSFGDIKGVVDTHDVNAIVSSKNDPLLTDGKELDDALSKTKDGDKFNHDGQSYQNQNGKPVPITDDPKNLPKTPWTLFGDSIPEGGVGIFNGKPYHKQLNVMHPIDDLDTENSKTVYRYGDYNPDVDNPPLRIAYTTEDAVKFFKAKLEVLKVAIVNKLKDEGYQQLIAKLAADLIKGKDIDKAISDLARGIGEGAVAGKFLDLLPLHEALEPLGGVVESVVPFELGQEFVGDFSKGFATHLVILAAKGKLPDNLDDLGRTTTMYTASFVTKEALTGYVTAVLSEMVGKTVGAVLGSIIPIIGHIIGYVGVSFLMKEFGDEIMAVYDFVDDLVSSVWEFLGDPINSLEDLWDRLTDDKWTERYGTDDSEIMYTDSKWEKVFAKGGDDVVLCYKGWNVVHGGRGNDIIIGNDGTLTENGLRPDELYGDEGNDFIMGKGHGDVLTGGSGDDYILGGDGPDTIFGDTRAGQTADGPDGDDFINGNTGEDTIYGASGNDVIRGGRDNDKLYGQEDDDQLYGGHGADLIDGGTGFDLARYDNSDGPVTVDLRTGVGSGGHAQGDTLLNIEGLVGSTFGDYLYGDTGDNVLSGLEGNDYLQGFEGNDRLFGGEGDDRLHGNQGDDFLQGNQGSDILKGGKGDDRLHGGRDNDEVYGQKGNDIVHGGKGDDYLDGGEGDDTLYTLENDIVTGGEGSDTFVIQKSPNSEVVIKDFDLENPNEKLDISDCSSILHPLHDVRDLEVVGNQNGDTVIKLPDNQTVVLENVKFQGNQQPLKGSDIIFTPPQTRAPVYSPKDPVVSSASSLSPGLLSYSSVISGFLATKRSVSQSLGFFSGGKTRQYRTQSKAPKTVMLLKQVSEVKVTHRQLPGSLRINYKRFSVHSTTKGLCVGQQCNPKVSCGIDLSIEKELGATLSTSPNAGIYGVKQYLVKASPACTQDDFKELGNYTYKQLPTNRQQQFINEIKSTTWLSLESAASTGAILLVRDLMLNRGYSQSVAEWASWSVAKSFAVARVGRSVYNGVGYIAALAPMCASTLVYQGLAKTGVVSKRAANICSNVASCTASYLTGQTLFGIGKMFAASTFASSLASMGENAFAEKYLKGGLQKKMVGIKKKYLFKVQPHLRRMVDSGSRDEKKAAKQFLGEIRSFFRATTKQPCMSHYAQAEALDKKFDRFIETSLEKEKGVVRLPGLNEEERSKEIAQPIL